MIQSLKAEVRKLLTVRSTYVLLIICLVFEGLTNIVGSFNASPNELNDPKQLINVITSTVMFLSVILAIVGILLVVHEYRYNTITYTLTAVKKRWQVLVSKFGVISAFTVLSVVLLILFIPLLTWVGMQLSDHHMVHQTTPSLAMLGRLVFATWAGSMLALVIAFIVRNPTAAFAVYFLLPSTIEPLLGIILKKNQDYLPFAAVDALINPHAISHATAAITVLIWVAVGSIAAWLLFERRDVS